MRRSTRSSTLSVGLLVCAMAHMASAQDWPQWRGPNRDAKQAGFSAPKNWPASLTQKWKVAVGEGVATPSLVDGKLYVFARQGSDEVLRCLDATSGKELWQQKYAAAPVGGPARSFSGPRCSPTVADGKIVTLGVEGVLSCHAAADGALLWRHEEFKGSVPRFATSSSPIVVDGLCIAQLGASDKGGIVAYDLATGKETWKWTGNGPAYGSPVLATVGGTKAIIAPTNDNLVALDAAKGALLWQIAYTQGRYNAATPMLDGETLIFAGPERGMTAVKLALADGKITIQELWKNADNSVQFNTPVVKDGLLYGLSATNNVFCIDTKNGATAWSAALAPSAGGSAAGAPPERGKEGGKERAKEGGKERGGRGGGGGAGYGSVVDAGSVLFALTPAGQLAVFASGKEKFEQRASYKVADGNTHAYPVVTGNRIFVKDGDSVTLWTTE
jgi:outer membrane protein assembly factor BamB